MLYVFRTLIEAEGWPEFELGWQGDPKLKPTRSSRRSCAAAMPYAAAGLHPLHTAGRQQTRCAVRVFVGGAAFEKIGQGRNTRMGMQPEALEGSSTIVEEIEKTNGFRSSPKSDKSSDGLWVRGSGPGCASQSDAQVRA